MPSPAPASTTAPPIASPVAFPLLSDLPRTMARDSGVLTTHAGTSA